MNDYQFGNFLCMLREKKGLTQADIATQLHLTPAAVSKWENGSSKPRVDVLFKLAEMLEVSPEELVAGHYIHKENDTASFDFKELNDRYEYIQRIDSCNRPKMKVRRILAWIIDWNIIGCAVIIFALITSALLYSNAPRVVTIPILSGIILLYPICFILRDVIFAGRSLGKRIMKLIVWDKKTDAPAKTGKRILRNIFLFIFPLDIIVMSISGSTLGDHLASTVVVLEDTLSDPTSACSPQEIIQKAEKYKAPKSKSNKKIIGLIIVTFVLFITLIFIITLTALQSVKDTPEYKLAYSYLLNSNAYSTLDADQSDIIFHQYSSKGSSSEDIRTLQYGFTVKSKQFVVIIHKNNESIEVCKECTKFN